MYSRAPADAVLPAAILALLISLESILLEIVLAQYHIISIFRMVKFVEIILVQIMA